MFIDVSLQDTYLTVIHDMARRTYSDAGAFACADGVMAALATHRPLIFGVPA
jgi:hypothetical protein